MKTKAFTLIEVLIAMAIFAIGFIAISAPLFVAANMQRQTINEVTLKGFSRSAQSILTSMNLQEADLLNAGAIKDGFLHPVNLINQGDRTYSSSEAILADRRWEWHTFARHDPVSNQWQVYALVGGRNILQVNGVATAAPGFLQNSAFVPNNVISLSPGECFLDSLGGIYRVVSYDKTQIITDAPINGSPTYIWYIDQARCYRVVLMAV